ncbi:MAG TPA: hypothetical protein VKB80_24790 [Kofleriaceae bacterium]|nr:hypothetical protein [Kofleriaceae bacterium]
MSPDGLAAARLRMRDGVLLFTDASASPPTHILKDSQTGLVFRLNATTRRLCELLDGSRTLDEVAAPFGESGGRTARGLVEKWSALGLVEPAEPFAAEPGAPAAPAAAGSESGGPPRLLSLLGRYNPLFLRLVSFDPTPMLRRIDRPLGWLFAPAAPPAFLALFGLAICLLASRHALVGRSFAVFGFFHHWVVVYVLMAVSGFIHETGHSLACWHLGRKVPSMGLLLYCFTLGAYSDVNDAWTLPWRQRVVVALGGLYLEAILWSAIALTWYATPPFSAPNQVAFVLLVVLGTRILLNLYPFLRLDGYFILSDLLGMPNLRPRSFAYLVTRVPGLRGRYRALAPTRLRQRIVYLVYGSLGMASVLAFMGWGLRFLHRVALRLVPGAADAIFAAVVALFLLAMAVGVFMFFWGLEHARRWTVPARGDGP